VLHSSEPISLSERSSSRRKLCPDLRVGADDGGVYGCRFPSWRHHLGLSLSRSMAQALRVKTQALACRSGRRRLFCHLPVVGVALVSQLCRLVRTFSFVGVGGRRGSGAGWWLCVEAAASGPMAGICFMVRSSCSHGLGDNLVSLVRLGCRLSMRLRGGGLTFRPGRRPRILVQWPWSASSLPCAARVAGG
jgi:hypothetical protein